MKLRNKTFLLLFSILLFSRFAIAQDANAEELAKKLSNPIASLISVPFQSNWDVGIGQYNGSKMVLNIQPVIPISLSEKWNLITRWIVPVVSQYDITGENTGQSGLGDAVISGFFSPANSDPVWGVGPALLVPIATNDFLGGKKFGVGPTAVVLKQSNGWTYGGLINHLFSVAGDKDRSDISATFINPFIAYNWKSGAGYTATIEYTHDWENDIDIFVLHPALMSAVTKFGNQIVSFTVGPRIHFAPENHAKYGVRAAVTLVFPK